MFGRSGSRFQATDVSLCEAHDRPEARPTTDACMHARRTTHLLFRTHASALQGSKVLTAQQWGVPIVHWQWLLDSVSRSDLFRALQSPCSDHLQML